MERLGGKKTCRYYKTCGNVENCLYCKGYEKRRFQKGDKVIINNPISYKRKGEIAIVKSDPSDNSTYVTVRFADGSSGKYRQDQVEFVERVK